MIDDGGRTSGPLVVAPNPHTYFPRAYTCSLLGARSELRTIVVADC